jgi:Spy/CpxP family protein refolding chaperone
MKHLSAVLLITSLAAGGLGISQTALADSHGMGMGHMDGKQYRMGHGGSGCWRASLTDEQRKKLDPLRLEYKKKVYPLKAKIKQAKVELALLIGSDSPKQKDIDKKIDEIAKLKAEKMRLKATHKIAVRKLLTPEQKTKFDMKLLKKAYKGKSGFKHGYHH